MLHIRVLIVIATILIFARYTPASVYVPLNDEVYTILTQLEAEGIIHSGLLTTRPLSYKEIARIIKEMERDPRSESGYIKGLISTLKKRFKEELMDISFIKPVERSYIIYIYQDLEDFSYNNDGDTYERGNNLRVGFSSRAELGLFSFYLNPEFRQSDNKGGLTVKNWYGILNLKGLELLVGKQSQWWGPGYHGALLLSNNATPFTMLKITNPHPVLLPWVLRYLGPFRFVFFVTRLEEERKDFPEPYLWGLRLNFKPIPYIETGLQRTAILGGSGRSEDLNTWLNSFTGKGENTIGVEAGDQRAGFDIKLTIPFKWQPLQLYAEAAGEDEAGGLPSHWAYLTGVYLPRILNLERISLRAEYATTHVEGHPNVWYNHHLYTEGYTYKGRIIGHHMGTDSKDIFMELSYHIPERDGRISISYDIEEHNLTGIIRQRNNEATLKISLRLKKDLKAKVSYGYGRITNAGNISDMSEKINKVMGMIEYTF